MVYFSCLLCDETAERVGSIEKHLRDDHDVFSGASDHWEKVDGEPGPAGDHTFLTDFA